PRPDPQLLPLADEGRPGPLRHPRHAPLRLGRRAAALPGALQDRGGAELLLFPRRLPAAPDHHLQPRPPHQGGQARPRSRAHRPLGNVARGLLPPLGSLPLRDLARRRRGRAGRRVRPLRVVRRTTAAVLALALTTCTCVINCGGPARTIERSVVVNGHTFKYRVWLPARFTKLRRW